MTVAGWIDPRPWTGRHRSSAPPGCTTPCATPTRPRRRHHGFLNVLLATRRAASTAPPTSDGRRHPRARPTPSTAARPSDAVEARRLAGARRWFTSFGSCSVSEPLDDLITLGLVPTGPTDGTERLTTTWVEGPRARPFDLDNLPYGVFSIADERAPRRCPDRRPRPRPRAGRRVATPASALRRGARARPRPQRASWRMGRTTWSDRPRLDHRVLTDEVHRARVEPHLLPLSRRDPAPAVRGRRLRRLLRLRAPRLQRRPDLPPRPGAAAAELEAPPGRLPRPRGHRRRLRHRRRAPVRPAQGARPRTAPTFGPSRRLDIEAELGFVVGTGSTAGRARSPPTQFADHVFGVVGLNDWSARDIQAWEYVPLGPFLGKSFATSISQLGHPARGARRRLDRPARPGPDAAALPGRPDAGPGASTSTSRWCSTVRSSAGRRTAPMYWSPAQMLAHITVNGASLRTGDLYASGTISGPEPGPARLVPRAELGRSGALRDRASGRAAAPSSRTATRWCCATPRPAPVAAGSRLGEVAGRIEPARP